MKKRKKKQIIRGIDTRLGHRKPPQTAAAKKIAALEAEVARLTQKCQERGNEVYLVKTQKEALEEKLQSMREVFNSFDSNFHRILRA